MNEWSVVYMFDAGSSSASYVAYALGHTLALAPTVKQHSGGDAEIAIH